MTPRVSVVAPTHRRCDGLGRFVEPLLAQPELDELVVAVDGSGDGSVEWLEERRRSDGRLVILDLPNRGAGPARAAGVEAASGDVVIMLDDDVIAGPGLVAGHRRHHAGLERKLVLGYMPNEWRRLPPGRRGIALVYGRTYEAYCALYASDPRAVLHGLWGGNFSMPRAQLLEVGVEGLAVARGQDDREFGVRCAKAGIAAVFDPSVRAEHLYVRDLAAWRRDCRLQGVSRRLLHAAHPDILGPELAADPAPSHVADAVGLGLPRPLRRVWPALARQPAFAMATSAFAAAFMAATRAGHLGLEVQAARAIGSLETMRGVLESA